MISCILLIITVIFFAVNMGGSGIAPSFASSYGCKFINKKIAMGLFTIFVILGSFMGRNVVKTLGHGIIPKDYLNFNTALIILFSAGISLFAANILKIPQSTSQVTVGAVVGAGVFFGHIYFRNLIFVFSMWILLPVISYVLTYYLSKIFYPPHRRNLWIYEHAFRKKNILRYISITASCYVAFAIGANNVANAVGPLAGAGLINPFIGFLLISPLFGLGGVIFGRHTLETFGKKIIPIGILTSSVTCFVTATLLIIATILGIPQSLVQLKGGTLIAVSSLKNGKGQSATAKKAYVIWILTPLLAMGISWFLLWVRYALFK